ncbi:hypothetical protein ACEQ8H_007030 [Pleosporales sp. CAS-2024a]
MPGFLSRSRSVQLLKGHGRDIPLDADENSMPGPGDSQTEIDRYHSATPISRRERDIASPDMAPRPSTSGGPRDRKTLFHMKTNAVVYIQSQDDPPSSFASNSTAVKTNAGATDTPEGIIGIALGSPTVGTHWAGTSQAPTTNITQSTENMSAWSPNSPLPSATRTAPPKTKLGRWKSIFKKAAPPPPPSPPPPPQPERPAFYQLATTITAATRAARADSHHDEELAKPVRSQVELSDHRSVGRTPSPPTFKRSIRASRAFTAPRIAPAPPQTRPRTVTANSLPANPRASMMRSTATPLPSNGISNGGASLGGGDKPLLDVSIPEITLERYSVMFGNLLQPTSSNRSSSLLARRQGNSEKLKPLDKLSVRDAEEESSIDIRLQRRATSPVAPSPRLSLFPTTRNSPVPSPRSSSLPRSRKLHRSQTAPEKSPLRKAFSRDEMARDMGQDLFIQKPAASPNPNAKVQPLALTPTSVRSFESDTDSITIVVSRSNPSRLLHLDDREPEWEILSKPAAPKRANTTPVDTQTTLQRAGSQSKQPAVTKLSALSSHPSSAPLEVPSPLERIQQMQSPPHSARPEKKKKTTTTTTTTTTMTMPDSEPRAMVGVARSVSVSRANSPRTLVNSPRILVRSASVRSPGATGGEKLLGHGQALTPTMVEVRNRKSQRVQLVDA